MWWAVDGCGGWMNWLWTNAFRTTLMRYLPGLSWQAFLSNERILPESLTILLTILLRHSEYPTHMVNRDHASFSQLRAYQERRFAELLLNGLPESTRMLETVNDMFERDVFDDDMVHLQDFAFESGLDFLFLWASRRTGGDPARTYQLYQQVLTERPNLSHRDLPIPERAAGRPPLGGGPRPRRTRRPRPRRGHSESQVI